MGKNLEIYLKYYTNNPWSWHTALYELSSYCDNHYNCNFFTTDEEDIYFKKYNYKLRDCEIIIYDAENDILKAVSFSEQRSEIIDIFEKRNNKNDILVISQSSVWFEEGILHKYYGNKGDQRKNNIFSIKQSSFYPYDPTFNLNHWNLKRYIYSKNNKLISDKMFFLCGTGRNDEQLLLQKNIITKKERNYSYTEYMDMAIKYKIGLSISGGSYEICHRDIEYMAIGLPMLRMEYINPLYPKLIPNYHYIAVPRKNKLKNPWTDLYGGEEYVEEYEKRFNEVVNDDPFLNFISKNAFEYYNNYCSPQNKIKILLKHLEL